MKTILNALIVCVLAAPALHADEWEDLAKYHFGDTGDAPEVAEQLIIKSPKSEHPAFEAKLIGIISSKKATRDGKTWACRMLQVIGTDKAVPALSGLLHDEVLSHYARLPLERMRSAAADQAMREALAGAPDQVKVGILGSLGVRKDPKAVSGITALTGKPDPVGKAAVLALGRIGGSDAASHLKSMNGTSVAFMEALVSCANQLEGEAAMGLYAKVLSAGGSSFRIAALKGMSRTNGKMASKLIMDAIKGDDAKMRKGALGLIAESNSKELSAALMKGLSAMGAAQQADVITALGAGGDASALGGITPYVKSESEAVRKAALNAVGKLGDGSTATMLLGMAGTPGVAETIAKMSGDGVDEALAAAIGDAKLRAAAIKALAARGSKTAAPSLLKLVGDGDAETRKEAWKALASLGTEKEIDGMMKAAVAIKDEGELASAGSVIKRVSSRSHDKDAAFELVAGYYDAGSEPIKSFILDVAAGTGNARALELERKALKSGSDVLKDKAVRALSAWPNESAADDLLGLARSASGKDALLALRGYIRIAGLQGVGLSGAERTSMFKQADALATRPDEKQLIISGLRNAGSVDAMSLLDGYMKQDAFRTAAELSAAELVHNLRMSNSPEVKALATRLAESANKSVAKKARAALAEMSKASAYVRNWVYNGPYSEKNKDANAVFKTAYPPEKGGSGLKWLPVQKGISDDRIDLEKAVRLGDNICAYLKTTVHSPKAQEVRLEMGSDDAIKAWLNGSLVHSKFASRGLRPGEDVVKVKLNKGANTLMLKVVDIAAGWEVSCRIMNDRGAVEGLRIEP